MKFIRKNKIRKPELGYYHPKYSILEKKVNSINFKPKLYRESLKEKIENQIKINEKYYSSKSNVSKYKRHINNSNSNSNRGSLNTIMIGSNNKLPNLNIGYSGGSIENTGNTRNTGNINNTANNTITSAPPM